MINRILAVLLIASACFACQSCTSRTWFDGFKETQKQKCSKSESRSEMQECYDQVNEMSYDQYKKDREEAIKKP
jgi:hypothetical protein